MLMKNKNIMISKIKEKNIQMKIKIKLKYIVVITMKKGLNIIINRKEKLLNKKIASNLRSRTSLACKSQNIRKTNKTFDLIGCSHSFLKNWIIHQLNGDMTLETFGSVWQIDHCLAIASFNLLDENEMKKIFSWINLRLMYGKGNIIKGDKNDHHLNLLQEVKPKFFMKLNAQEGLY